MRSEERAEDAEMSDDPMSTQPDALTAARQYTEHERRRVLEMVATCEAGGFTPDGIDILRRIYARDCRMLLVALTTAQQERDCALAERDAARRQASRFRKYLVLAGRRDLAVAGDEWEARAVALASPPAPSAGRETGAAHD